MKLVAAKPFRNTKALGIDARKLDCDHDGQVDKGARFTIGKSDVFKDLANADKQNVAQLLVAGCAVIDNADNEARVKQIDAEVKQEKSAAKTGAATQSLPELIAAAVATALANAKPAAAAAK